MDNRIKRNLVKFFKQMNKSNLTLLKEDKSLKKGIEDIKDIENIEDDEELIQEGIKQCEFILNHFSRKEKQRIIREEKVKDIYYKKDLKEKEEREKREREREKERETERGTIEIIIE